MVECVKVFPNKSFNLTRLLSRFLRESESKRFELSQKARQLNASQVKPMLDGRALKARALGKERRGFI
jgi:hypothetical protein